jgi:phenylalanyl-tRNA synthetase alpha subunit
MVYEIINSLDKSGKYSEADIWYSSPVTTVSDNYDALLVPKDAQCRHPRYNRYLDDGQMLRTMTSSLMPRLIQAYNKDALLIHPGICYRRDVKDKHHVGEPHQIDIWQISSTPKTDTIEDVTETVLKRLGKLSGLISEISLLSETPYEELPQQAIKRMKMKPNQKNVLLRLVIQNPSRDITKAEANQLRDLALNLR